jgi:hypothetical protein
MRQECQAASWWCVSQLANSYPPLTKQQLTVFAQTLTENFIAKFSGHWYLDEPDRGSAYRSISKDSRITDKTLKLAAKSANIDNIEKRLPNDFIMWIDPFKVQVQFSNTRKRIDVYTSEENTFENSSSPSNCKPIFKSIAPTILVNKLRT